MLIFTDKKQEQIDDNVAKIQKLDEAILKINESLEKLNGRLDSLEVSLEGTSSKVDTNFLDIENIKVGAELNKASDENTRKDVDVIRTAVKQLEWLCEKGRKEFLDFLTDKFDTDYNEYCMANETQYKTRMSSFPIVLPNGKKGKFYEASFQVPNELLKDIKIVDADKIVAPQGLEVKYDDDKQEFTIKGVPEVAGDFEINLNYTCPGWTEGKPILEKPIPFTVNPNPRDIWNDIPTPEDIPYFQPDKECDYVKVLEKDGQPAKDITVASIRGRSHAHKGIPRDDHYRVEFNEENEWYVMAVADGAGSAKYSRKGSTIACDMAIDYCNEELKKNTVLEEQIKLFNEEQDLEKKKEYKKAVLDILYSILANAALKATQAIDNEVVRVNSEIDKYETEGKKEDAAVPVIMEKVSNRDYATTLLLCICKKFDFGWFIASFWVGDGAICIYKKGIDEKPSMAKMMGVPDSGEQAGQTVFITMKSMVFKDRIALFNRLNFEILDDFDALFLMTDGVSDPMFETDNNLANPEKWDEFWDNLRGNNEDKAVVNLTDDNEESKNELQKWLDFYIEGNHDDRTIAILY